MSADSERRMLSMLARIGLDPAIAAGRTPDSIFKFAIDVVMKTVRQRCRACQAVDTCERWLADIAACDNTFCPNATVFSELKMAFEQSAERD